MELNYFKIEKDFKINSILKIREQKDDLKKYKMKRNIIEDELANMEKITIKSLDCLALIYKLNIIYIKNRTYFLMNYNNEKISDCNNVIEEKDNCINILTISESILKNILDNYYHIENANKPIKALSSYTSKDLIKICKTLNIDLYLNNKLKLKKELYSDICSFF